MKNKNEKFFSLYTGINGLLYSYILVIVHNHSAAEDLLQETASVLWEKFDEYEEGTNFSAWAICIAKNKCLQFLRANKKTKELFKVDFYEQIANVAERSSHDYSRRLKALDECMQKLSKNSQKLLRLRYKKNLPVKEISLRTGWSVNQLYYQSSQIFDLLRICVSKSLAFQDE